MEIATYLYPDFKGKQTVFYQITGYPKYAISKTGQVVNLRTERLIKGCRIKAGYIYFNLKRADDKSRNESRHRLMAKMFIPCDGNIDELFVNHINGIAGDDWLGNLEWVTPKRNVEHAGEIGINPKCLPLLVRDSDTGEITKYPSYIEYARLAGLSKDAIAYRALTDGTRVFPERKQFKQVHSTTPWYIPEDVDKALLTNGTLKGCVIRNVLTEEETYFDSQNEMAQHIGFAISTVSIWLDNPDQPVLPGLIQMKRLRDNLPWREVGDPYIEMEEFTNFKVVVVNRVGYSEEQIFESMVDCAKAMDVKVTTLHNRLKSNGRVIYSDGCTYRYYNPKN